MKTFAQNFYSRTRISFLICALAWLTLSTVQVRAAADSDASSSHDVGERPRFTVTQQDGIDWLVRPNGERFFSFGSNCVGQGILQASYNPKNPGYAAWQHYPDSNSWAKTTLDRLQSWGLTTIGGWSDLQVLRQCSNMNMGMVAVLHLGSTSGAPWFDMWDPKVIAKIDDTARAQIVPLRDDPRVIGYFSDNELGWWNASLFQITLAQPATSEQRRRLVQLLHEIYHNNWEELSADFVPEKAGNWPELEQHGQLYLRPGGHGIATMRRALGMLAARYYSLVHDIIRKYDPQALVLGDRYQSFYFPEVASAAAPYVDIISSNLSAAWNDGTFPRFFLTTLHSLTGKPILVSEFYMAARQNRSGNQNDSTVYPLVETQQERADGFRNTMTALARTPYVVGADWFQYYDEPTHGRDDGENFNFGFVDIHDRPYDPLVKAAAGLQLTSRKTHPLLNRPNASLGVPPAPSDPLGQFQLTLALKNWDRERGFVEPASDKPLADLYISWDQHAIYLGLYAQDMIEDAYYQDKKIHPDDRPEWTVTLGPSHKEIRARVGASMVATVNEPSVQVVTVQGKNLRVQNVAAMRLPAQLFGKESFHAGDKVEIASDLAAYLDAYQVSWKGTFTLAGK
ncbi:hypothetical protein [Edaphobacter bradus]|uniref:hypothetical protein n=1 Tax=Edaphobacter bradus TaxID=2259016 RepID=UPI0021E0860B|nr:hypothetical protein [Edaphobacter bradus]